MICKRRSCLWAIVLAFGFAAVPASGQSSPVPLDAVVYGRVDLKSFWTGDSFKEMRTTFLKADLPLLADFQKRFPITPMNLEGVSFYALPTEPGRPPLPYGLLHMNADVEPEKIFKLIDVETIPKSVGKSKYYFIQKAEVEVQFLDKRTILVCAEGGVEFAAKRKAEAKGSLAELIEAKNAGKSFIVGFDAGLMPPQAKQQVPPDFQPLMEVKTIVVVFQSSNSEVKVELNYPTPEAAKAAEDSIKKALEIARTELKKAREEMLKEYAKEKFKDDMQGLVVNAALVYASGGFNQFDEFLANPGLEIKGNQISKTLKIPDMGLGMGSIGTTSVLAGLLIPAVQKIREAAARAKSQNNMKQIILSFHNYESTYGVLPPDAIRDKNGKALLSWRVAILPYVRSNELYKKFKLDEPWDSENNKKLIPLMPNVFLNPSSTVGPGMSNYRVFTGKHTIFEPGKKLAIIQIQDGSSNTGGIFDAAEGVEWTKPDDLAYDKKLDVAKLLRFSNGATMVGFMDGHIQMVSDKIKPILWHYIIDPADGNVINLEP